MHGYPKTDVGGSNRGTEASPVKRLRVYPRLSGAATDCRPSLGLPENDGKPGKNDGKTTGLSDPRSYEPIV
jgi:hypothetical protein